LSKSGAFISDPDPNLTKLQILTDPEPKILYLNNFFEKIKKVIKKTQNFMQISNPLKKSLQNAQKAMNKQIDKHEKKGKGHIFSYDL
jgi:hypothetical protein